MSEKIVPLEINRPAGRSGGRVILWLQKKTRKVTPEFTSFVTAGVWTHTDTQTQPLMGEY